MKSPVRPGPNAYDLGGASKPSVNTQPYNNQRLAEQNQLQNIGSAAPQAAANAMGQVRSQTAAGSDARSKSTTVCCRAYVRSTVCQSVWLCTDEDEFSDAIT